MDARPGGTAQASAKLNSLRNIVSIREVKSLNERLTN